MDISHNIKRTAEKFVEGLRHVYGSDLVSVALYGSAASGEYALKRSNINIAVVLKDTSIPSVKKASCLARKRAFLRVNPVFFTEDYIRSSADVFPVEFLDIKENHAILYGSDPFREIEIDAKNLRFQCEQELKSKIINIKKAYLMAGNTAFLREMLFKSLTSSLHILRNLVRLKGKAPSYKKELVIEEVGREFSIDTGIFNRILAARNGNVRLGRKEMDGLFAGLVATLETISDKVDRF
jgi:predicted nucleotidyltransferase